MHTVDMQEPVRPPTAVKGPTALTRAAPLSLRGKPSPPMHTVARTAVQD